MAVLLDPTTKVEVTTKGLDFDDFDDLNRAWTPLTLALNSLNGSMGLHDHIRSSSRSPRSGRVASSTT